MARTTTKYHPKLNYHKHISQAMSYPFLGIKKGERWPNQSQPLHSTKDVIPHFSQSNHKTTKRENNFSRPSNISTQRYPSTKHPEKLWNFTESISKAIVRAIARKKVRHVNFLEKYSKSDSTRDSSWNKKLFGRTSVHYLPGIPCTEPPAEMLLSMPLPGSATPDTDRTGLQKIRVSPRATLESSVLRNSMYNQRILRIFLVDRTRLEAVYTTRRVHGTARAPARQTADCLAAISELPHRRG